MSLSKTDSRLRGFTLTELAIVLGVIGAILGAIWVAAAGTYSKTRAKQATTEVQQILAGYRVIFSSHPVDSGAGWVDITCLGINTGAFPSDMLQGVTCTNGVPSGGVAGPWPGTTVTVRGDGSYNGILISFWNVPQDGCIALASYEATAPGLIQSWIGTGGGPNAIKYPPYGGGDTNGTAPLYRMTSTDINSFCIAGSNTNEVTFEYSIK